MTTPRVVVSASYLERLAFADPTLTIRHDRGLSEDYVEVGGVRYLTKVVPAQRSAS